ncbi:terminase small subunit [Peribacillus sp. JNUCC 23]
MPNWDEIRIEYETSKITLQALADKHDVKIGTLKSRKSREGWSRDPTKKDATEKQKVATIKPIIESDDLNDKQKMFCLYYIKYFNATKAYQKAYQCSYEVANKNAYTLMVKHGIKQEIERLKTERQQGIFIDAQAVLQKYIDIAFADITDFVDFGQKEQPEVNPLSGEPLLDENGDQVMYSYSYVDFKNADEVDGTLITEIKKGKDGVSVKLADKMKALEFLSKYTDLLSENERKKLQEEKLKTEIEKIKGDKGTTTKESEVAAMLRRMAGESDG